MNTRQKNARRKQIREVERLRKQKKKIQLLDEELDDEMEMDEDAPEEESMMSAEDGETEEEDMGEEKKKKSPSIHKSIEKEGMGMGEGVYMGPTSFEELDAIHMAREQANELREVSWNVQDLVYNIIQHPMLKPKEKGAAIKKVGEGFEQRVSAILSGDMLHKDLDVLTIEAILAHDARRTGMLEKTLDILKEKVSYGSRKNMPDGNFALVYTDANGNKVRKYLIHDKSHVRNALARAAQQIEAGGEGAADAKKALPKIRAAAKKFGIEMDTEKEKTGLVIEKDAKGDWRWIGWSTNKFMDWDGEIMADASHKEYTEWLDQNPEMSPVFMSWHTPETVRKNAVDFWTYENGFLIMSGLLTEVEAEGLLRVQKETDLGMSHGTIVLSRDPQNKKIITKYRMYEVSELPLENAANPFTSFDTVIKEAGMDKKKYFASLFGEDKAEKYLALTKKAEENLKDSGVKQAEKKDSDNGQPSAASGQPAAGSSQPAVDQKALVDEIVKTVGEKFGMEELNAYLQQAQESIEKVPVLEELVKSLAENQDEALAEKISPKAGRYVWMQKARASQSADTKLKEGDEQDEKLKKSAPTIDPNADWLAAQTGIQPIRMQQ